MLNLRKTLIFLALTAPLISHADTHPYVRMTAGQLYTDPGQSQTIQFSTDYWKTHHPDHDNLAAIFGGVSAGLRMSLSDRIEAEVGLGLYQAQSLTLNGKVYQYGSPQFYNMNYDYKIINQRIMLEGKLLATYGRIYHPYVSGGVGVGRNRSYAYQETPIASFAVPDPAYHSSSQSSTAYGLGFGVDVDVAKNWRVGVGYEYSHLGKAKLGKSSGQSTPQFIKLNNITANQVMLTATYSFN